MPTDRVLRDKMLDGWERFLRREIDSDHLLDDFISEGLNSEDLGARTVASTFFGSYCDECYWHAAEITDDDRRLTLFLRSDFDAAEEQSGCLPAIGLYSFPLFTALAVVFGLLDGFLYGLPWALAAILIPAFTLPWKVPPDWPFRSHEDYLACLQSHVPSASNPEVCG